jgi:hypothetical protein
MNLCLKKEPAASEIDFHYSPCGHMSLFESLIFASGSASRDKHHTHPQSVGFAGRGAADSPACVYVFDVSGGAAVR